MGGSGPLTVTHEKRRDRSGSVTEAATLVTATSTRGAAADTSLHRCRAADKRDNAVRRADNAYSDGRLPIVDRGYGTENMITIMKFMMNMNLLTGIR